MLSHSCGLNENHQVEQEGDEADGESDKETKCPVAKSGVDLVSVLLLQHLNLERHFSLQMLILFLESLYLGGEEVNEIAFSSETPEILFDGLHRPMDLVLKIVLNHEQSLVEFILSQRVVPGLLHQFGEMGLETVIVVMSHLFGGLGAY